MKKSLPILLAFILAFIFWSCEQPESPDFQVNQQFEIPLTVEKSYPFLGGDEALLDTTSEDFEDLFESDSDGPVKLVKEAKVNFGDLSDAIPQVEVTPKEVNSEVGEIELRDFASSGDVGSISTGDIVTGGSNLEEGDPLEPGSINEVKIDNFDPDYFESAEVANDGTLNIVITNNLGFHADNNLNVILKSNGTVVGSDEISPLNQGNTGTAIIDLSTGTQLSNLEVELDVAWSGDDDMVADAGGLVVSEVYGQDDGNPSDGLMLSQVTAKIDIQSFDKEETTNIETEDFEFREQGDVIELSDSTEGVNKLNINISNNIDIGIQSLGITFSGIEDDEGNPYSINISGIDGNSSTSKIYDISEYKITSETIRYSVSAKTENTQNASDPSTIHMSDNLVADISLQGLDILRAKGYTAPREILLSEDVTNDGEENLDVFNNDEADVTAIDGIGQISDRISDLTFDNPKLSTIYNTNLGVNTTIYAVIAGTDNNGNTEFLTGTDGSPYQVQNDELADLPLEVDGVKVDESQVIKFQIQTAENPDPDEGEKGANEFNSTNTSSSAFFSNLPSNIRFVGVAEVNEADETGTIVNPVIFEPRFGVEIPFSLSADNASYKDTVDADLSDLPEEEEDSKLSEATITINYTNGLPLDMSLNLIMLDENGDEVTTKNDITINGAATGDDGFVSDGAQSEHEISFSDTEMNALHRTRSMVMDININTPEQQSVNIRESDAVSFKVKVRAGLTSTIN